MNFAGAEELDVRAKIRPRVGATLVKPKQTDTAIITPEAPRTGLGVGVTISQSLSEIISFDGKAFST